MWWLVMTKTNASSRRSVDLNEAGNPLDDEEPYIVKRGLTANTIRVESLSRLCIIALGSIA